MDGYHQCFFRECMAYLPVRVTQADNPIVLFIDAMGFLEIFLNNLKTEVDTTTIRTKPTSRNN